MVIKLFASFLDEDKTSTAESFCGIHNEAERKAAICKYFPA